MDLRQLECFLTVTEHLHFGRAAEALFLSQPTVSENVRRLERELGGALFVRTTRRVTLTPLGREFHEDARMAYDALIRAYERGRALAREQENEFRLGHVGAVDPLLLDVVAEVQRRCAGVFVSLVAMPTPQQVAAVREGRLHAAVCCLPELAPGLEAAPLGGFEMAAVLPADHPLADRAELSLAEVAAEPLIAWPRSINPPLYDHFAAAMDGTGVPWTLVGTAAGVDNVAARVLSGFGIGIVFESLAAGLRIDGVRCVRLTGAGLPLPRSLLWRRGERHPGLPTFLRLAGEAFGGAALSVQPDADRPAPHRATRMTVPPVSAVG